MKVALFPGTSKSPLDHHEDALDALRTLTRMYVLHDRLREPLSRGLSKFHSYSPSQAAKAVSELQHGCASDFRSSVRSELVEAFQILFTVRDEDCKVRWDDIRGRFVEEVVVFVLAKYRGDLRRDELARDAVIQIRDDQGTRVVESPAHLDVAYWLPLVLRGEFYECKCDPQALTKDYQRHGRDSQLQLLMNLRDALNEGDASAITGAVTLVSVQAMNVVLGGFRIRLFGYDNIHRLIGLLP